MPNQSAGNNHNSVVVQNTGDNVIITIGATTVTLAQKHRAHARPPNNDLELLHADLRAITLLGRDTDLTALAAWRDSPADMSVRVLTGRAGAGKTRLAIEACDHAATAGWTAGFLNHRTLDHDLTQWRWGDPMFIVVDYAAAATRPLREWLATLATLPPGLPKLRLVLLERHADPHSGWFRDLFAPAGLSSRGPDSLLDPPAPIPLAPLTDPAHRRALLTQVMTKAAALSHKPPPALPAPGDDLDFDRRLAADDLDHEPLYLAMAGLVAVTSGAPTALALSRLDLAHRIAAAERARLDRLAHAWKLDADLLAHLATIVSLQGGADRASLESLIAEEVEAMGWPPSATPERLATHLHDALPAPEGAVAPIQPDLIGEAFVLATLTRDNRPLPRQQSIIARAAARAFLPTVQFVIRTAQDYCEGDEAHPSLLWLDRLVDSTDDPDSLVAIAAALPKQTVNLLHLAVGIQRRIVAALGKSATDSVAQLDQIARNQHNLAVRLSDVGQPQLALAAANKSLEIRDRLASQYPGFFLPDLALSLSNIAAIQRAVGDHRQALIVGDRTVEIYRVLFEQSPDSFQSELAMSLNNLASIRFDGGQLQLALEAAREASDLYQPLAEKEPDAFKPEWAQSISTLGILLGYAGQNQSALQYSQQAVDIFYELATRRPDAFRPRLASALNNLSNRLSASGMLGPALKAARDSEHIYKKLADQHPTSFRAEYAGVLSTLANRLNEHKDYQAALAAAQEASHIFRSINSERIGAFSQDIAKSLMISAHSLENLNRNAESLAANADSIAAISVQFFDYPEVCYYLMGAILLEYLRRCQRLEVPPDGALISPIISILTSVNSQEPPPS